MPGDNQFAKCGPDGASVEVDLDPNFTDLYTDAYLSTYVYIPSTVLPDLSANTGTRYTLVQTDDFLLSVRHHSGTVDWCSENTGAGSNFAPVTFDAWVQVEIHAVAGATTYDVKIGGSTYTGLNSSFLPATGVNFLAGINFPASIVGDGGGVAADDWVGFDDMAWSFTNWISSGGTVFARWSFDGVDPLNDANTNWPDPPWATNPTPLLTLETGGQNNADIAPGEGGGGGPTHTYAIDLSFISYRARGSGDIDEDQSVSHLAASSTYPIDLSAIKYRAFEFGDTEEVEI